MAKKPDKKTLQDLKQPEQPTLPGTEGQGSAPETEEGATDMARKPTQAGKKEWSFAIKHDQEIPAVQRTGRRLPFNFDDMKVGSMFTVPKEFWLEFSGLKQDQASDPARNKEAIRRSFYAWRDKDEKRAKFALAFSDQFDKQTKAYTGVNVYMATAQAKAA